MTIRPGRDTMLSQFALWVLIGSGALLLGGGCQGDRIQPAQQWLALGDPADAAVRDSLLRRPTCGKLPPVGCCEGEALWLCKEGLLKGINCTGRPHCGWSNSGFFDCNTSGQADPSGIYSRSCPKDNSGNSTLPLLDGGGGDGAPDACKGIVMEGCCSGNLLKYCLDGELRQLDCTLNLACGWKANGGLYDCGTAGGVDPSEKFPRSCPGSPDAQADLAVDHGLTDQTADTSGERGPGPGCTCSTAASPREQGLLLAFLMVLLGGLRMWGHRRSFTR